MTMLNNYLGYNRELCFKFLVIGDFGVGKTSIIKRYAEDTFSSTYKITIGADFAIKTIEWDDNTKITVQMWDIAGHERFGVLTSVYYKYALGAAIVFDLTRLETLTSVEKWLEDLREKTITKNGQDFPVILLANKGDIALEKVPEGLDEFCKQHNILTWFVTSAKENINLDTAMNTLLNICVQHWSISEPKSPSIITLSPELNEEKTKERKTFCFF